MANPFSVAVPDILGALMLGQKQYDAGRLSAGRAEAVQALQSGGDVRGTLARLLSIGDVEGANAVARYADQQATNDYRNRSLAQTGQLQQAQIANMQDQRRLQENTLAETVRGRQESLALQRAAMEGQRVPPGFARGSDGLTPIPGGPADPSYIKSTTLARDKGIPLTATDKKAIIEADESVLAAETAIDGLKKAKELSKKAYSGPFAKERGYASGITGSESGQATVELDNTITSNALSQLKAVFGGLPTEGERKILLEVQGSVNLPPALREKIYDRAIAAAERRLEFNRRRATEMRGGTFYTPQPNKPNMNLTGPGKEITGVEVTDIPPPAGFIENKR